MLGVTLAIALLLSGQGAFVTGRAQAARPAASGSTLTIVMAHDAVGLDPQAVEDNSAGFVMATIFDQLLEYRPGTVTVGPGLATSYTMSNDGKTYTFTLRKGVRFQDGTPFNATALVEDLDRLLNPRNKYYVLKQPGVESFISFTYGLVTSYTAVNKDTVRITLSRPFAPFPASLAMVWSGVMSPAAVRKYGALGVLQHPVGTGPYRFVEWVKNDHITVAANPYYWGPKPHIQRIIFQARSWR
jgi:peptide/nickel transport system substrate-binding protein